MDDNLTTNPNLKIEYEYRELRGNRLRLYYMCTCVCGNQRAIRSDIYRSTKSCGCLTNYEHTYSHNMAYTKEYKAWQSMKDRCMNPKTSHWDIYGGAGIRVSPLWVNDFEKFYEHIGPCPSREMSVDRIDTFGNYEPGNVRWAYSEQQTRNRKKSKKNTSGHTGITKKVMKDGLFRWVASSKRLDGSTWSKSFSQKIYGEDALEKAIEFRDHMIKVLNEQGAGYTESHGK